MWVLTKRWLWGTVMKPASLIHNMLCFSLSWFSNQPLSLLLLPQCRISKSQGCLSAQGVAAVNLCILGLIGHDASRPERCQRLCRLTQLKSAERWWLWRLLKLNYLVGCSKLLCSPFVAPLNIAYHHHIKSQYILCYNLCKNNILK